MSAFSLAGKRVYVAGHRGMVGSAIVRRLAEEPCEVLTVDHSSLDLLDQTATRRWLLEHRPDAIILAAARVGGILANDSHPANFIYENLSIACNVIEAAHRADINRLLFLGSSCIYPKLAPQPITEDSLLTGALEPTNEWYAVAKIAGVKLCQAFRKQYGRDYVSAMPTNLYGPGDNFDLSSSHVLPALIRKAHEAKEASADSMTIWGTGKPMREFLHANDCADACVFLLEKYSSDKHVNVGVGLDLSILDLASLVCKIVGFEGVIICDESKPDGTPRKLLDISLLTSLGWQPSISLEEGIGESYKWYLANMPTGRN
jgi:GDP-L-fucose synthase